MADKLIHIAGKRKKAVARATIKKGKGGVKVNLRPLELYDPKYARMRIQDAIAVARDFVDLNSIQIGVKTNGGGVFGQADAIASSIARGLCEWTGSDELLAAYQAHDRTLIAGDHRLTETHKPGQSSKGPRHKRQKSYR
ncbi:MAG: 30S ribosomal protein S9 [Candidatus Altiarchaeota archaeon]